MKRLKQMFYHNAALPYAKCVKRAKIPIKLETTPINACALEQRPEVITITTDNGIFPTILLMLVWF